MNFCVTTYLKTEYQLFCLKTKNNKKSRKPKTYKYQQFIKHQHGEKNLRVALISAIHKQTFNAT
jgi:hypothetical protein